MDRRRSQIHESDTASKRFALCQAKEECWQQERATTQQTVDRLQLQLSDLEARHNEGVAGTGNGKHFLGVAEMQLCNTACDEPAAVVATGTQAINDRDAAVAALGEARAALAQAQERQHQVHLHSNRARYLARRWVHIVLHRIGGTR